MFGILKREKKKVDYAEELLTVKKAINYLKNELDNPKLDEKTREEYERKLEKYYKIFERVQEHMFDVKKGLYIGIGVELNSDDQEPKPIYLKWKSLNSHMGVQGTTRVGKSVFMLNNIRQHIKKNDNVIVIEPKGGEQQELLSAILEFLAENDRLDDFFYISPAFIDLSDRINPIFGMNNESIASLVSKLVESPGTERFFSDVVYKITLAITTSFEVIEMFRDPYQEKTKKLIANEILKWNDFIKNKGIAREVVRRDFGIYDPDAAKLASAENQFMVEPKDYLFSRTLMTFRDIAEYSTYERLVNLRDIVKNLIFPDNVKIDEGLRKKMELKKTQAISILDDVFAQEKDFFTKISTSLSTIMTQLSAGNMGHILCDIRINPLFMRLMHPDKRVCAIIQPFPMMFKKVSDMAVKIFLEMLEYVFGEVGATGRSLNQRIDFHIDEAASVVQDGIHSYVNKVGGLGGSMYFYTQSFADWKMVLGDAQAKVVMDNINTQVRMRMNDNESCEIVSKEFGTKKVFKVSSMYADNESRQMVDVTEEWIVPPSVVKRLPVARALVKNDTKIYLVDLPYYSGPQGALRMPSINTEKLTQEMEQQNMLIQDALYHMQTAVKHVPTHS